MQNDIDRLNSWVKLRLASSSIHGIGVFAIVDIPKNTKLYANLVPYPFKISKGNLGKLLPHVKEELVSRWAMITEGQGFAYPDVIYQAYMNHSDTPNYSNQLDVVVRDIKAGEEITEDYSVIPGADCAYPWLDVKR